MQVSNELNNADATKLQPDMITDVTKEAAPVAHRVSAHRSRISQIVKELESERLELRSRIEQLRRQAEAVDQGFAHQIADVEATLKLYENGLNSIPIRID